MVYKTIALNTFFQLLARFFSSFANFILVLLVANSLGSFGLGQYNKVFTFIGIFSLFVDFGMNAAYLKIKQHEVYFFSLVALRLTLATLIFLLIQPILWLLPYNNQLAIGYSPMEKMYIEIIALSLFLYSFIHSIQALYQSKEKFNLLIYPNIAMATGLIAVGSYAYFLHSLTLFFWAAIVGWILFIAVGLITLRTFSKLSMNIDYEVIKGLFIKSLPLGATLFLNVLYVRMDTLILSFMKTTSDVGIYTLAYKFFEFPLTLSFFMMNALYPIFLKTKQETAEKFSLLIKKSFGAILSISLLLTLILFVLAPLLSFIKQDFSASIEPFRLLVLSYPIFFISNLLLWVIITENKEKKLPIVYLVSLFTNVVLNLIFIPQFGYNAAAITTGISEIVVLVLLIVLMKKK